MLIRGLKKKYISIITVITVFFYVFATNQGHKFWTFEDKVIEWDVKSYYAYLPAAFIYDDLSFNYVHEHEDSKYLKTQTWPVKLENGKYIIKTSMGMSYIYLPAFFIANQVAPSLGYKADGYSKPYKYLITMLALFYLLLGIIYLRKLLLLYDFSELSIFISIISIVAGTNLIFYSSYEPGMTHVYNFTLITIFIYNTALWWKNKRIKNLIYLGLLGGLIALIRPTNIIVYLLFLLWNIGSLTQLWERFKYFFTNFKLLILLIGLYMLPWIPQLIFWKIQTGHFLYFSYGESNESFFFNNPQVFNILFSYWKGWYVYTPLMFIATLGFFTLYKKIKWLSIIIIIFMSLIIYVLSSWWSWWFGGCFGNRAFIDFYGIMAIPLASLIMFLFKKKVTKFITIGFLALLIFYNNFQIRQYNSGAINCWSMTKEMYWEQFMKIEKTEHYNNIIKIPDHEAARNGVFRLVEKKEKPSND